MRLHVEQERAGTERVARADDPARLPDAGAGLDVFATEPLPATSRLWELPNVIFSPHISGGHEGYMRHATEVFVDNLRRYVNGQKLRNVVDKKKGY